MCDIDFNQLLTYDPDTGYLFWKERLQEDFPEMAQLKQWNGRCAGKMAFTDIGTAGYPRSTIFGKGYLAHQVIWSMHTGRWPEGEIDHIDGDRKNNRVENLREVSSSDNRRNTRLRKGNTTGVHGVYQMRNGKWGARINSLPNKRVWLGTFDTLEEAAKCRKEAEIKHGYHENHGRTP